MLYTCGCCLARHMYAAFCTAERRRCLTGFCKSPTMPLPSIWRKTCQTLCSDFKTASPWWRWATRPHKELNFPRFVRTNHSEPRCVLGGLLVTRIWRCPVYNLYGESAPGAFCMKPWRRALAVSSRGYDRIWWPGCILTQRRCPAYNWYGESAPGAFCAKPWRRALGRVL